jgi:hypothetical protein
MSIIPDEDYLIKEQKEYNEILNHLITLVSTTYKEKKNRSEVFTKLSLIKSMFQVLDKNVFYNPYVKWLDTSNGIGNFSIYIYSILMYTLKEYNNDKLDLRNEDIRKKHILENMLYVCELDKKNCLLYKILLNDKNKYKLNIFQGDSLEIDLFKQWNLKTSDYIITIGNPPYNRGIWKKFIKKFIPISKEFLFIIPSTFTINYNRKQYIDLLLKNGLKTIKFMGKPFDKVNIEILFFHTKKNYNGDIFLNNFQINRNYDIIDAKNIDEYNLIKKLKNYKHMKLLTGKNLTLNYNVKRIYESSYTIKNKEETGFNIRMLSRLAGGINCEFLWVEENLNDESFHKILFPCGTAGYKSITNLKKLSKPIVKSRYSDKNECISKSIKYVNLSKKEHYEKINWYILESKVSRFIFLKLNKWETINTSIFLYIPKIEFDLLEELTNNKLFELLKLTKKEIDIINSYF